MKEFFKNILAGFIVVLVSAIIIFCSIGAGILFSKIGVQMNGWTAIFVLLLALGGIAVAVMLMALVGYLARQYIMTNQYDKYNEELNID